MCYMYFWCCVYVCFWCSYDQYHFQFFNYNQNQTETSLLYACSYYHTIAIINKSFPGSMKPVFSHTWQMKVHSMFGHKIIITQYMFKSRSMSNMWFSNQESIPGHSPRMQQIINSKQLHNQIVLFGHNLFSVWLTIIIKSIIIYSYMIILSRDKNGPPQYGNENCKHTCEFSTMRGIIHHSQRYECEGQNENGEKCN